MIFEKKWTATDVEEILHTKMRKTNNCKTESLGLFNHHLRQATKRYGQGYEKPR